MKIDCMLLPRIPWDIYTNRQGVMLFLSPNQLLLTVQHKFTLVPLVGQGAKEWCGWGWLFWYYSKWKRKNIHTVLTKEQFHSVET